MKSLFRRTLYAAVLAVAATAFVPVALAVPASINFQGYLTNADGSAVDSTVSITFAAYNVDIGGVPLWSQTSSVDVDQGLFSIALADMVNPFPTGLFDTPVYIGLFVAGEEMLPRRELSSVAFSFKAADADTLEGMSAASLDQSGDVTALQGDVTALQGDVTAVQGDISAVAGDLASVDGRVTTLEATGADITGVGAGAGLAGGGASGNVTVSIATGGINATMMGANSVGSGAIVTGAVGTSEIATDSVTSSKIAANAVGPTELNSGLAYTVNGLTSTGPTLLQNALTIQAGSDIIIRDNFNGFRWYDDAGTEQFGAILMRSTEASFFDANQNRYVFRSDANGLGIGTTLTNTGYDVSLPSLSVAGQTSVGLERVFANYPLSSTASCHAHGNLTCFYGTGNVACPVGKRVLGGGTTGTNARYGAIGQSYPSSNTGWTCSASYDLVSNSRNCYAICARLE